MKMMDKIFKRVENVGGKGENAVYELFLFSRGVFKRRVLQTHKNKGFFVNGLNTRSQLKTNFFTMVDQAFITLQHIVQSGLKLTPSPFFFFLNNRRNHSCFVSLRSPVPLSLSAFYVLKVALQILERKFYKNIKKSPLYCKSLLIFIHKTQVDIVEKPSDNKRN